VALPAPAPTPEGRRESLDEDLRRQPAKYNRCDVEKIGPIRLVIDVLDVTPDEAASFIVDSDRVINSMS
jgi:hypothetical protein